MTGEVVGSRDKETDTDTDSWSFVEQRYRLLPTE